MSQRTSCQLTVKIFLGFFLSTELKNYLIYHSSWKADQLIGINKLEETHYMEGIYVGKFIPNSKPTIMEIKELGNTLIQSLEFYCPELIVNKFPLILFPQMFIG